MMIPVLEQSRAFPFIAWTTVAIFSGLTIMLVMRLQVELEKFDSVRAYQEDVLQGNWDSRSD